MNTPEQEGTGRGQILPEVTEDTFFGIMGDIETQPDYMVETDEVMRQENPVLHRWMSTYLETFDDPSESYDRLVALTMVYRSLRAQGEIDHLERAFIT